MQSNRFIANAIKNEALLFLLFFLCHSLCVQETTDFIFNATQSFALCLAPSVCVCALFIHLRLFSLKFFAFFCQLFVKCESTRAFNKMLFTLLCRAADEMGLHVWHYSCSGGRKMPLLWATRTTKRIVAPSRHMQICKVKITTSETEIAIYPYGDCDYAVIIWFLQIVFLFRTSEFVSQVLLRSGWW